MAGIFINFTFNDVTKMIFSRNSAGLLDASDPLVDKYPSDDTGLSFSLLKLALND